MGEKKAYSKQLIKTKKNIEINKTRHKEAIIRDTKKIFKKSMRDNDDYCYNTMKIHFETGEWDIYIIFNKTNLRSERKFKINYY